MRRGTGKFAAAAAIAFCLSVLSPHAARAAFLGFDDTNPNETITVSANDFEAGLVVLGTLFQLGIANPATGVFPEDGVISFTGAWFAPGGIGTGTRVVYLIEPGTPAGTPVLISDILQFQWTTAGNDGIITGNFLSDTTGNLGPLPAGVDPNDVFVEGTPVIVGLPFLTIQVMSDVGDVPAPGSLALLGLGLGLLPLVRLAARKRR